MTRAVLLCLLLAAVPAATHAQAAAPQTPSARIAFVNVREVLRRTPGYAAAESTFTREFESYQNEVRRLQQQLDSAVQSFEQQSIALSPTARTAKQRELQGMQQSLEQRTGQLNDRAQARERELLQPIQSRVNSVIQGLRAELNFAVIFDTSAAGIVAADPALDITGRVLERLQAAP